MAWSGTAVAQSDSDLALIPPDSQSPVKVGARRSGENIYLENALTGASLRGALPVAAPPSYDWQERLPGASDEPPSSGGRSLKNELAVGDSYTTASRVTWNLEYHLNQAGLSSRDWSRWLALGSSAAASPAIARELWYIRGYALDQQEQSTEQGAFLWADWTDAFGVDLELSGFVNVDLHDGSGQAQGQADYYLSNAWTIGLLAAGDFGARRSDFGSLPTAYSVLLSLRHYF